MRDLLLGVGNPFRLDDGIGHWVANRITEQLCVQFGRWQAAVEILCVSGEGGELLNLWQQRERVFVVDAVQAQGNLGRIYRFAAHERPLPRSFFNYSTHNFSVAEAVEMGRMLNLLPQELYVWGIEGAMFGMGGGISEVVLGAGEVVVGEVLERVAL